MLFTSASPWDLMRGIFTIYSKFNQINMLCVQTVPNSTLHLFVLGNKPADCDADQINGSWNMRTTYRLTEIPPSKVRSSICASNNLDSRIKSWNSTTFISLWLPVIRTTHSRPSDEWPAVFTLRTERRQCDVLDISHRCASMCSSTKMIQQQADFKHTSCHHV